MSEYNYNGRVDKMLIAEAIDTYRQYKSEREPFIARIRDNEAFYRQSYERLYSGINNNMQCDTPFIFGSMKCDIEGG